MVTTSTTEIKEIVMIAITGASGQLGGLVIGALLEQVKPNELIALVRDPAKASALAAKGVAVRRADYDDAGTLAAALAGVDRLLLISSSEIGKRAQQHRAVIDAAKKAGVALVAYTSVLHADTSILDLAAEHRDTEQALRESGLPHVVLRNGWYSENYTAGLPGALERGVLPGSAGEGRISSAARADYALAAAAVIAGEGQAGRVYELAGDTSYTLAELAAIASAQSGKPLRYQNLPRADYQAALTGAGLPEAVADLLAGFDVAASTGALFDDSRQLGALIGRPTTPISASVALAS